MFAVFAIWLSVFAQIRVVSLVDVRPSIDCPHTAIIYTNVAQLKQKLEQFDFNFTSNQWEAIPSGLIGIEGMQPGTYNLEIVNIPSGHAVNNTVFVKQSYLPGFQHAASSNREAIIIDPDKYIVKYLDTGMYGYVDSTNLEYKNVPDKGSFRVRVIPLDPERYIDKPIPEMNLTYVTTNLRWLADHSVEISYREDGQPEIRMFTYATIYNKQDNAICLKSTTLLATRLQTGGPDYAFNRAPLAAASRLSAMAKSADYATVIENDEIPIQYEATEAATSVRTFFLGGPENIQAKGFVTRLLFIPTLTEAKRISKRSLSLYDAAGKGKMRKYIRIRAKQYMPPGNVKIKDQDWIAHRTELPELASGEKYDLDFGDENDMTYEYSIVVTPANTTEVLSIQASKGMQLSVITVNMTFINYNDRRVQSIELTLRHNAGRILAITFDDEGKQEQVKYKQSDKLIKMNVDLVASETMNMRFTVFAEIPVPKPVSHQLHLDKRSIMYGA